MSSLTPADADYESRVRASFAAQQVMTTIGATLDRVLPGEVWISLPHRDTITQQHGFVHAGIVATVLDSACGYAAHSLMGADDGVLTVEYKINLMAPARGEHIEAHGRVVRAGRTLTVCRGEAMAVEDGVTTPVAVMQATIMTIRGRSDVRG
jgi:uncharacterized protein (TIGR00369 family)